MRFLTRFTFYILRFTIHQLRRLDFGLVIAALLTLLIIHSLLRPGLPTAADYAIHLYRTMEYKQAWGPGVILPRWAPNLAFGYGYPLFVFAPPLPYLLGLLFHLLGFSLEGALKLLIIFTILLYGTGMYLLARDLLRSVAAGLIAAVAYAFAPFALREALLYGGNIPQFLAIGLFPWTLWAAVRAARSGRWPWIVLAAGCYAAILLSHLFHALIFTPVHGLFILILIWQNHPSPQRPTTDHQSFTSHPSFLTLMSIIPLGLLLSAFFWLPALIERFETRAQADVYLEKSPFFIRYPHWTELVAWIEPLDARAANPYVPLSLGVITLILATLGLLFGLWAMMRHSSFFIRPQQTHITTASALHTQSPHVLISLLLYFAIIAIFGIFMSLSPSRPVWDNVPVLQLAQFPWRLLGLVNLGLALLAGAAALWLPLKMRPALTALIIVIQIVAVAPLLYPVTAFSRYHQRTIADQVDYERRSQSVGLTTLGEYLPRTAPHPPTTSPLVDAFLADRYPPRLDQDSLPDRAKATLIGQSAVTHHYHLDSDSPFTLRLFHYLYPGWRAWLDDQLVTIQPDPDTGFMLIDIPAGDHTLLVHFGETPLRLASMVLSGLTVVGLIGIWFWLKRREAKTQENQNKISSAPPPLRFSALLLLTVVSIITAAFIIKPLLRPLFTIRSPAEQVIPATQTVDVRFDLGIRLVGYQLEQQIVDPGDYLRVVLYWETDEAPLRVNLQPFVHLDRLGEGATLAGSTNYTPGDVTTESNLPTFHWDTTRYVRDEHDLTVPFDALPQAYALRAGLIDPDQDGRLLSLADGSGDTAPLALINVRPTAPPEPLANPLEIKFRHQEDNLDLEAFQVDEVTSSSLNFTLAWHTEQPLQRDYTIFAQLLDMNHNLVTGFDQPPLGGAYPTSTWLPDQTILDRRTIPLDGVAAGTYRLIIGLYDSVGQQRMVTESGTDFVELTTVTIE